MRADHQADLLTTGKAARLCAVKPDTILKWIKRGRLEAVRTAGGHYRIEPQDIELLTRGTRSEGTAKARRLRPRNAFPSPCGAGSI